MPLLHWLGQVPQKLERLVKLVEICYCLVIFGTHLLLFVPLLGVEESFLVLLILVLFEELFHPHVCHLVGQSGQLVLLLLHPNDVFVDKLPILLRLDHLFNCHQSLRGLIGRLTPFFIFHKPIVTQMVVYAVVVRGRVLGELRCKDGSSPC